MDNNTNVNNDKGKIMVLVSLIIAVSIMLVVFVFLAVIDITKKDASSKLKTTTRRTVVTKPSGDESELPTTDEPTTTEEPTTATTTKTSTTAQRITTTTKGAGTKVTTKAPEETVIPSHTYEVVTDATTYPDALDTWEWNVINLINEERRRNGLNELLVARELRNKAEEAAYMYYASGSESLKPYLSGISYLYMHSNLDIDAHALYESTLNSTKITTNPDLRYVGAGVLLKNVTLDTYFYVIVYE